MRSIPFGLSTRPDRLRRKRSTCRLAGQCARCRAVRPELRRGRRKLRAARRSGVGAIPVGDHRRRRLSGAASDDARRRGAERAGVASALGARGGASGRARASHAERRRARCNAAARGDAASHALHARPERRYQSQPAGGDHQRRHRVVRAFQNLLDELATAPS